MEPKQGILPHCSPQHQPGRLPLLILRPLVSKSVLGRRWETGLSPVIRQVPWKWRASGPLTLALGKSAQGGPRLDVWTDVSCCGRYLEWSMGEAGASMSSFSQSRYRASDQFWHIISTEDIRRTSRSFCTELYSFACELCFGKLLLVRTNLKTVTLNSSDFKETSGLALNMHFETCVCLQKEASQEHSTPCFELSVKSGHHVPRTLYGNKAFV